MNGLKKIILTLFLLLFTSCGTQTQIDPNNGFDMWEYMTSASNYEVTYVVYENDIQVDTYVETQKQYGSEFERISSNATTTLYSSSDSILMQEPNNSINVIRYLQLGDRNIFQSSTLELCTLDRFYNEYQNRGHLFYNVLQVKCTTTSGVYQEIYYGYNEGIVSIYEENSGVVTEYVKISEKAIF